MKEFLLKIFIFFIVVVGIDVAMGKLMAYLADNAKGGFTARDNYICNKMQTDLLLCGSSHCVRHYNPKLFEEAFGISCYNSGQQGNGIILLYGRLLLINRRQKPKKVIYDVTPAFDLLKGDDNHRYLSWLKSYYDEDGIADIFESIDKTEKLKMFSQMYRYNSRIIEILVDYFSPISSSREDGFSPLEGEMNLLKIKSDTQKDDTDYSFDPLKIEYLNKFISEIGEDNIIFVVSPSWYGLDTKQLEPIKNICEEKGILLVDFSNDPKYVHQNRYFKDGNHLNAKGANEFTRDLITKLKKELNNSL